jgi:hypothetical protein
MDVKLAADRVDGRRRWVVLAELLKDAAVLVLDLGDGSARFVEPNAGVVEVVCEEAESPYVFSRHAFHYVRY